jgi:SagB-type dehydrogenase family enzyme
MLNNILCASTSLLVVMIFVASCFSQTQTGAERTSQERVMKLPNPAFDGKISVEKALKARTSVREYSNAPLTLSEISQILWAAQGITEVIEKQPPTWRGMKWMGGHRTAPSAGALYPLELYLLAGNVDGLPASVYKYIPVSHSIETVMEGDKRVELSKAALGQVCIQRGMAVIVIAAVYERTAFKYGERARQYVHMEVGAAGQNIYLQSGSLGLGTVFVGAFKDEEVRSVLRLPADEFPLAIMPLGRK